MHVTVTIDGQPTSSDTPVTFVRVRDKDTVTGKPTGPLRAGILVAGEPQYDVELLSDGVPVAAVGPRSARDRTHLRPGVRGRRRRGAGGPDMGTRAPPAGGGLIVGLIRPCYR